MHTTDDFDYELPESRIAQFPPEVRGNSKLLVYQDGQVTHHVFSELPEFTESGDLIIFNNTRVIPARMHFRRESGASIEIFLLEPLKPYAQTERAMQSPGDQEWECIIGNLKKWKQGEQLALKTPSGIHIQAELLDRAKRTVRLKWEGDVPFAQVLNEVGKMPLPPYIHRETTALDSNRYQTVYAKFDGAVAAPTAGLHFTPPLLQELKDRGIDTAFVSLHVGAGTFKPVKEKDFRSHDMHAESFSVERPVLEQLLRARRVIATGTTSLRTLESIYWMGVKLKQSAGDPFILAQFEHEQLPGNFEFRETVQVLLNYLKEQDLDRLEGRTSIMITPEYRIRSINGLITNFHLPKSTLIMLIASWVGTNWRQIYREALENDYRFLSYGDSSLLFSTDIPG